jgi:very-short-patch-repair endonuclease
MIEYFTIISSFEDNNPTISIKIKKEFLKEENVFREDGKPFSSSQKEYFLHHFGEEKGEEIYQFYKKFFNKKYAFEYAFENNLIDSSKKEIVSQYFFEIDQKTKINHLKSITPEFIEKQKKTYNKEFHSKKMKDWYAIPGNKERMYEACHNKEIKEKRKKSYQNWYQNGGKEVLKIVCNKPDRIKKISEASKNMWANATEKQLIKLLKSSFNKTCEVSGIKMNTIEAEIAKILNELNLSWVYEKRIKFGESFIPDFIVENKLIIECLGDFWHGNPELFSETDFLFKNKTAKDIWEKDKKRSDVLIENGYKFLSFWEKDIKTNKEKIKESIKKEMEKNV